MYGISGDSRKCLTTAVSYRVDSEKVQEHGPPVNASGEKLPDFVVNRKRALSAEQISAQKLIAEFALRVVLLA